MMAIALLVFVGGLIAVAGVPDEAEYVGSKKCKLCHLKETKTWKATKHANNFEVLEGEERSNPDCVKCHTTGYGKPGGFVSEEDTPNLTSTGCEACHGAGSEHAAAAKKAGSSKDWDKMIDKTPKNACISCHNPHVRQGERAKKLREANS